MKGLLPEYLGRLEVQLALVNIEGCIKWWGRSQTVSGTQETLMAWGGSAGIMGKDSTLLRSHWPFRRVVRSFYFLLRLSIYLSIGLVLDLWWLNRIVCNPSLKYIFIYQKMNKQTKTSLNVFCFRIFIKIQKS